MADALRHRGPDGEGFYSDGPIALGHRRLSIIDIGGGAQPVFNEDGSVAAIFNGEVYNYHALREELKSGHQLRPEHAPQVLGHRYQTYAHEMLARLRGRF